MPFFNKELSSTHKNRMELRNRYLKKRSYQNKRLYTKERNFYVFLLRKTKKKILRQSNSQSNFEQQSNHYFLTN